MKYKVGDKVRVINNSNDNQFKIGEIVTITHLYENTDNPTASHYKANSNNDSWWVNDNNIEPFNYKDMTKCIVLGEAKSEEPKKAVVFIKNIYMSNQEIHLDQATNPSAFDNIELVSKHNPHYSGYDVMFAYHTDRSNGYFYLGYYNDGVV